MPVTICIKSHDAAIKMQRETLAHLVEAQFECQLPESTLLCFFDDADCQQFKEAIGTANRGFYLCIKFKEPCWLDWPDYVTDCILVDDLPSLWKKRIFDHVIYLHGSTCATDAGLGMTFAHEVQHFVQHETVPKLWAEGTLMNDFLVRVDRVVIDTMKLNWFHNPIEREARAVSKQVAEHLCGKEQVRLYIDGRIAKNVSTDDVADWQFIQNLNPSSPYNLENETRLLFQRLKSYKRELETALQWCKKSGDHAFDCVDLNTLLNGTT
jgi:hypothetical protein